MMRKLSNNHSGTMATGTMMILISSIVSTGAIGSMMIYTTESMNDQALDVVNDTVSNMVNGFTVVDAVGTYENNSMVSISYIVRNSPGSAPVELSNVSVILNTETNQSVFVLDTAQVIIFNNNNNTYLERGELAKITILLNNLAVGEQINMKMIVPNGQVMDVSFTVPDSLGNNFVVF